jgi:hypothetical protein
MFLDLAFQILLLYSLIVIYNDNGNTYMIGCICSRLRLFCMLNESLIQIEIYKDLIDKIFLFFFTFLLVINITKIRPFPPEQSRNLIYCGFIFLSYVYVFMCIEIYYMLYELYYII